MSRLNLGDIELSVWQAAIERLIHASGEDELHQALQTYVKDHVLLVAYKGRALARVTGTALLPVSLKIPDGLTMTCSITITGKRSKRTKEELFVNKKIGALVYDAAIDRMDVRYGLNRYLGGLHCGEQFEVLVNGQWFPTRIEKDKDWYLVGIKTSSLIGLLVRI